MSHSAFPRRAQPVSNETRAAFESLLPSIERIAAYAFRRCSRWRRLELIADVAATAYIAFVRLVERGLKALAYASALAKFAIRHVRAGREVGCQQSLRDTLSPLAQRYQGFSGVTIGNETESGDWEELTAGRKANPADIASCRIDFATWLDRLNRFKKEVALRLAAGDSTSEAAMYFGVSRARISQLRRELLTNWDVFQAAPAIS